MLLINPASFRRLHCASQFTRQANAAFDVLYHLRRREPCGRSRDGHGLVTY
jgi:hypothetical protein